MFCVKERIGRGATVSLDITDKNVYTRCPGCRKVFQVNLEEVFKVGGVDLFSTVVLCDECSERIQRRKRCDSK